MAPEAEARGIEMHSGSGDADAGAELFDTGSCVTEKCTEEGESGEGETEPGSLVMRTRVDGLEEVPAAEESVAQLHRTGK